MPSLTDYSSVRFGAPREWTPKKKERMTRIVEEALGKPIGQVISDFDALSQSPDTVVRDTQRRLTQTTQNALDRKNEIDRKYSPLVNMDRAIGRVVTHVKRAVRNFNLRKNK